MAAGAALPRTPLVSPAPGPPRPGAAEEGAAGGAGSPLGLARRAPAPRSLHARHPCRETHASLCLLVLVVDGLGHRLCVAARAEQGALICGRGSSGKGGVKGGGCAAAAWGARRRFHRSLRWVPRPAPRGDPSRSSRRRLGSRPPRCARACPRPGAATRETRLFFSSIADARAAGVAAAPIATPPTRPRPRASRPTHHPSRRPLCLTPSLSLPSLSPHTAMPPKFDPSDLIEVFVRATGGEVGAASSLAPKIGPLGLSPKKIGEDIAKETAKEWKGLRVTVKLSVQNRVAKVSVVPSAAALVIKALKEPLRDRKKVRGHGGGGLSDRGSGGVDCGRRPSAWPSRPLSSLALRSRSFPFFFGSPLAFLPLSSRSRPPQEKDIKHNGNLNLDEVVEIARIMRDRSCAKKLTGTVRFSERWGKAAGASAARPALTTFDLRPRTPLTSLPLFARPSRTHRSRRSWARACPSAAPWTARTPARSRPRSTRARSTCRRSERNEWGRDCVCHEGMGEGRGESSDAFAPRLSVPVFLGWARPCHSRDRDRAGRVWGRGGVSLCCGVFSSSEVLSCFAPVGPRFSTDRAPLPSRSLHMRFAHTPSHTLSHTPRQEKNVSKKPPHTHAHTPAP